PSRISRSPRHTTELFDSWRRLDTQQRTLVLVSEQVEKAIRPLSNLADALSQVPQHGFAPHLLVSCIEDDPLQMAGARNAYLHQRTDEHIALPGGNPVAGIDGHSCHGDGRHPEDQRRLDALLRRMRRDAATGVVAPETHLWPSVIATGQDDVDLI